MKVTEKEFIELLKKHGGLYARVAREIGISRQAVRDRVENNPHIMEIKDNSTEENLDDAEWELRALIKDKTVNESVRLAAIKYYLSTIGKKRGFVERQEHDHTSLGEKINIPPIIWANGSIGESKDQ